MILVDTSVWVDHLRHADGALARHLGQLHVLAHPFVTLEIALGNLTQRNLVVDALQSLPQAPVASDEEVHAFVLANGLFGRGIGFVDVHLLASARLSPNAALWTRDKRLRSAAESLGIAADII